MPKIMIDPGHFGSRYNQGVISSYYESNMTWELAGYLKKELESYGITVGMTRATKDEDLAVYQRGKKAKGYDLLVSLHSNAITTESVKRVILYKPLNGSGNAIAEKLGKTIVQVMNLSGEFYYQALTRADDDGTDYYGVIRGAAAVGVPGLILEHSFHTNKEACTWLMNSENLKKLAVAEAATIAEYYGVKKPESVIYRVQVGAYSVKANADACLAKVKAAGFTDAFITTSKVTVETKTETVKPKKTVDELAKEVLQGKWGTGNTRKEALTKAGYDYEAVQKRVNELV